MELHKTVIKSGNSSAVVLPKSWQGSQVLVKQIKKPINISADVLKIIKDYLPEVNGIYLVGSYARNSQTKNSDIDIVIITNKINKIIKIDPYEIILVSQESLSKLQPIEKLTLQSMLNDAKPLLGKSMLKSYQIQLKLKKSEELECYKRLKKSLDNIKKLINLNKKNKYVEGISYSSILVLRALDVLKNNKITLTKKDLNSLGEIYQNYQKIRNNTTTKDQLPYDKALKIYHDLLSKWQKEKKLKRQ